MAAAAVSSPNLKCASGANSLFGLLALAAGVVLVFTSIGAAFSDSTSDGVGQAVIGAGLGVVLAWVGDRLLRTANDDAESDLGDDSGLV